MLQQQFFYNAANCSAFIDLPYRLDLKIQPQ